MKIEEAKPASKKKKAFAGLLALLAVLALTWGGYQAWLAFSVPAMPRTAEDIDALYDDVRYQNMSAQERRPYLDHMNDMYASMSEDDRRRLEERFQRGDIDAQDRMDFFIQILRSAQATVAAAETEAERDAALDGIIAMMSAMEGQEGRRGPPGEDREGDGPSDEEREQGEGMMNQFLDSGDPQVMGYMSELFKLIEQRRAERGMPPMIPGG